MTTATELLREASRALELLPPEESADLLSRISGFLGEPVHLGDVITIKSGRVDERWSGDLSAVPEGLVVTTHESTYTDRDGNEKDFTYNTYQWPEAGEARYLAANDYKGGFVVAINGRRYRVDIHIGNDDGMPTDAAVTFTRTDDPESEFKTWDHAEAVANYRKELLQHIEDERQTIANAEADAFGNGRDRADAIEWAQDAIASYERKIAEIDAGQMHLGHPFYCQVFGQPNFIQNEMFPMHNGRMGMALASIETGWGDAGNVNILFACDENGVPCKVWFEASCC